MELAITLNNRSTEPLHKQLYNELRVAILNSRLIAGEKLPATRALSHSLGVSRTTVAQSYEQLLSEGYLETRRGAGTFVSRQIPDNLIDCPKRKDKSSPQAVSQYPLSAYGQKIASRSLERPSSPADFICFRYGSPAFKVLPWKLWKRLINKHCNLAQPILDYSDDWQGHKPLRKAIARYLSRSRAAQCAADQIIIVSGSQQALDLCSRLFVSPGEKVIIEDPSYLGARQIFNTAGAQLMPVPVDHAGLITHRLPHRSAQKFKLIYVTPSHQFPTGAVMSLPRRLELLAWAQEQNTVIVEDDYDSEFRYQGSPIPSLQGLDTNDLVIYIGTFSKVLFPALRIAYMIVPEALTSLFAQAKWLLDRQNPMLEQCVLAEFIEGGHLERHIRRMRTYYDQLRTVLVNSLNRAFAERISILGDSTGLHIMVRLLSAYTNEELLERAHRYKVAITDAQVYYHKKGGKGEFLLGYSDLTIKEIQEGVKRLARAVRANS